MMKCKTAQRYVLLSMTGELPASKKHMLEEHLSGCASCCDYSSRAEQILNAADSALLSGEPRAETMDSICRAAADRAEKRLVVFPVPMSQVLAYVAVFLCLLVGAVAYLGRGGQQLTDTQIAHVGTIVDLLSEDGATEEMDRRDLARQLLRLEGLLIEDSEEEFILPEEPVPTDLQTRSTGVFHPAECV